MRYRNPAAFHLSSERSNTRATYRYDGANRRVTFYDGTNTRHYYYSDQWQVLEERLNATSTYDQRYVFGLRYLDDLILRDDGGTRHDAPEDHSAVSWPALTQPE